MDLVRYKTEFGQVKFSTYLSNQADKDTQVEALLYSTASYDDFLDLIVEVEPSQRLMLVCRSVKHIANFLDYAKLLTEAKYELFRTGEVIDFFVEIFGALLLFELVLTVAFKFVELSLCHDELISKIKADLFDIISVDQRCKSKGIPDLSQSQNRHPKHYEKSQVSPASLLWLIRLLLVCFPL